MTFQERINEIEALLNQYKENGFTSEEIEAVKEKVNTIKNDYDSGVFNEKKASSSSDEYSDQLLEKLTAKTHVNSPGGQRESRRF